MDMFDEQVGREAGDDMARTSTKPIDNDLVDGFVSRLKRDVSNGEEFKVVMAEIADHASLSAVEIIEIAHRFVGGLKPKSRKAALTTISQERLRLSHAKAKAETAAKARTW